MIGLTVVRRWDDEHGNPRSVWLRLGEADVPFVAIERIDVTSSRRERPVSESPAWHCVALGIRPNERQAWRERLEAAGHVVERETRYTLYTRDPDDNLIGLSHYPEPAPSW